MARFELPVMNTSVSAPAESASSTAYWINGLSTMGSISFGLALVAGRNLVPRPATGNTTVFTIVFGIWQLYVTYRNNNGFNHGAPSDRSYIRRSLVRQAPS